MIVKSITGMGIYGKHSILGANYRHLISKYELRTNNVLKEWDSTCSKQTNLIRIADQIKELCYMRDTYKTAYLTRNDTVEIINLLCTE